MQQKLLQEKETLMIKNQLTNKKVMKLKVMIKKLKVMIKWCHKIL